ncbi:hypothetical protein BT69DRAFT_1351573 [Atractiella rhizophila]|nr:hypothetical protein BT69DRAFT_1351573 [Atractiella rhizophila]
MNSEEGYSSSECAQAREDEITVLESIFPDLLTVHSTTSLTLNIPINLPSAMSFSFVSSSLSPITSTSATNITLDTDTKTPKDIKYLPPLCLHIEVRDDYPDRLDFDEILSDGGSCGGKWRLEGQWEVQGLKWEEILREGLGEVYVPGCPTIYSLSDWLVSTIPARFASLPSPLLIIPPTKPDSATTSKADLSATVAEYDKKARREAFMAEAYECEICLLEKMGAECRALRHCGCVFCEECLKSYFSLLITEGSIQFVFCPSQKCTEERTAWGKTQRAMERYPNQEGLAKVSELDIGPGRVEAEEIEEMLGAEMRNRLDRLKEKRLVESDPTNCYCPREVCQAPVPKDKDYERLRICPSCSFSFCIFCKRVYHGVNPCKIVSSGDGIVGQYIAASEQEKRELEIRYGAGVLKKLVDAHLEEKATNEWINSNTQKCPACLSAIQKSVGCNHMTCSKCSKHYCYRCGTSLKPENPYAHFSLPGPCFQKLFDWEDVARQRIGMDANWIPPDEDQF